MGEQAGVLLSAHQGPEQCAVGKISGVLFHKLSDPLQVLFIITQYIKHVFHLFLQKTTIGQPRCPMIQTKKLKNKSQSRCN